MCKYYTASLGARLRPVYDVIASFLCLKLASRLASDSTTQQSSGWTQPFIRNAQLVLLHLIQRTRGSDTIRVCYREQGVPAVFQRQCVRV